MLPPSLGLRRVVEYSSFFVGEEPIDVSTTLKLFSRDTLVRMAVVFSLHYGNLCIPNPKQTLFSKYSLKHKDYLNKLFKAYFQRIELGQDQKVEILTYRTSLELWRQIFAIREDEFTNVVDVSDTELLLFKVILSINERIMSFTQRKEEYTLDELIFLNGFLTNDSNNYDFKKIILPQLYYFSQLVDFVPSNDVLSRASEQLLRNYGIDNWKQYFATLFFLAHETDRYIRKKENGILIITHEMLDWNRESGLLSPSLVEHLSIDEDEYIPFPEDDSDVNELNVDYRRFRSRPFVRLKDGSGYVVINNQLVCERLFNSLFFDFKPLINGKEGSFGSFDYNKCFIEKVLFRKTLFKCIPSGCFTFPGREDDNTRDDSHEPDFYARTAKAELIIAECKAIKMNGECRDDGDYVRLLDELHEKIVLKTRNLDKLRQSHKKVNEPIGIGQLIHHIDSIEADDFQWDKEIPDDVIYYPLMVFEDVKLVQKGILSMVNRWFYEEIQKKDELVLSKISCMPIMVVSINTLHLYDDYLLKKGLTNIIDLFVAKNAKYNPQTGQYLVAEDADFEGYLQSFTYNKTGEMSKWCKRLFDGHTQGNGVRSSSYEGS